MTELYKLKSEIAGLRRLIKAAAIGYIILGSGVGYALQENASNSNKTHELAQSSAAARVHTVKQRCDLTKLIAGGLPKQHDKLILSYNKCEEQLKEVKELANEK